MLKRLNEARKNEGGFTLIELLLVIVILGVLSGIVVFAVKGITDRGDIAACKSDVKSISVAQEAYYSKNGSYAANVAALNAAGLLRDATSAYASTDNTGAVTKLGTAPAGC